MPDETAASLALDDDRTVRACIATNTTLPTIIRTAAKDGLPAALASAGLVAAENAGALELLSRGRWWELSVFAD